MKSVVFLVAILAITATTATAQTKGRVGVGASATWVKPTDSGLASTVSVGPLVRLNPRKGWGGAGALNWFTVDLENPSGDSAPFANLRVRPLMAGVAYTVGSSPALASFSVVAGPSFNRVRLEDGFLNRIPAGAVRPELHVKNSFVVRPGIGVTFTVAPRAAIVGFGGYMINRPDITYRDEAGREFVNRWKADAVVLSVGVVYSLF